METVEYVCIVKIERVRSIFFRRLILPVGVECHEAV